VDNLRKHYPRLDIYLEYPGSEDSGESAETLSKFSYIPRVSRIVDNLRKHYPWLDIPSPG